MRAFPSVRRAFAVAIVAGLAVLGGPAWPAAAAGAQATAPASALASKPGINHFNVGATHSPQLLQALAGPQSQTALVHPAASAAAGSVLAGPVAPPAAALAGAVQGIDVASAQHPKSAKYPLGAPINWTQVAGAGYQFTGIKATEAAYYTNPYYASDLAAAKTAGLSVFAYSFANPWPGDQQANGTAVQQADYLVSNATVVGSVPPLALDIEYNPYINQEPGGNICYSLTPSAMVTWISQFIAEVQSRTGQLPMVYTTADWWQSCTGGSTAFGRDPMWVANYTTAASPTLPVGWSNWALWQYSSTGIVPGISGKTDLDQLNPAVIPLFAPGTQNSIAGSAVTPVTVKAFTVSSGSALAYAATGLPPGLLINSASGQISGTPTAAGNYQVTVTATAGAATGSVSFTWDIRGKVTVTSPGTLSTVAGNPVDLQVQAADSAAGQTLSYSATGLPAGLSMSSRGLITGWPASPAGTHPVTVTVTAPLSVPGSASFTWAVTAAPGTGPTGPVHLNLAGKCLDDRGDSSANGTTIQIWSCVSGGKSQQWTVAADQTLRINGKCLSVAGSATAQGSKAVLETCSGAASQQWRVGTTAELVNPVSAMCLDDPGSSTANGTPVEIWSCTAANAEKWTLPAGPVVSQIPSGCLDDFGNSTKPGNPIDLWPCNGGAAQNWTAEPDGTVRVHGMCLDVYNALTASGSVLDLAGCSYGAVAQQWKILTDGGGVELQNPHSALCLADPGDSTASGTRLVIGACSTADPGVRWRIH